MEESTALRARDERIQALIADELDDLIRVRHHLHQTPEIMFEERETSAFIQQELDRLGVQYKTGYGLGTGIVAHLPAVPAPVSTAPPSCCIGVRADMDALPIRETTGVPYASARDGRMHACGHDGHMTIQIGVLRVLAKCETRPFPVTFLFQPAEEGGAGGKHMVKEGALLGDGAGGLGPPVTHIFGLHGWPETPLGAVSCKEGALMAAASMFNMEITGKQSHAALPHCGHDPIVAAAAVVSALQHIVSRTVNPLESAIVTVGAINGGKTHNVIPTTVTLRGTCRSFSNALGTALNDRVVSVATSVAAGFGCTVRVVFEPNPYPALINDSEMTRHFFKTAAAVLGDEPVMRCPPTMGGEDFAFFAQQIPAAFYFIGLGRSGAAQLHQPDFNFADDAIALGVRLQCHLALADPRSPAADQDRV